MSFDDCWLQRLNVRLRYAAATDLDLAFNVTVIHHADERCDSDRMERKSSNVIRTTLEASATEPSRIPTLLDVMASRRRVAAAAVADRTYAWNRRSHATRDRLRIESRSRFRHATRFHVTTAFQRLHKSRPFAMEERCIGDRKGIVDTTDSFENSGSISTRSRLKSIAAYRGFTAILYYHMPAR